jgi:tyrosine-protein kinase Etk/Wzc
MNKEQDSRRGAAPGASELAPARAEGGGPPRPRRDAEPSVADLLWTLSRGRWVILGITAAVLGLAAAYLVLATRIYQSSVLIQVEDKTKSVAGLENLAAMLSDATPAETEMEIIRSRALLGAVVDQLGLDIDAYPRTLPLVGRLMARRHGGPAPADAPLGLRKFAWGGERIRVPRLTVSDDLRSAPWTLTALGEGR